MMQWFLLVVGAVLVALIIAVAARNADGVAVDLLLAHPELPMALWLALALCAGALLTLLCLAPRLWRGRRERKRIEKELASVRAERDHLRTLPLRDR